MTVARVAVAFPGQGVDPVDTGRILDEHRTHPLVRDLAAHLGTSDWAALDLSDTRVAQPAVYAASLLSAHDARAAGELDPVAVTGHSLGELAALAFAEVYTDEAGLALAVRRAALGHSVQTARPGAMTVVLRLDAATVEDVRRQATSAGGVLAIAVENGPEQFVLSGDRAAAEHARDLAERRGGVARLLGIGGAFHSPLMTEAAEQFATAARAVIERDPTVPAVSSTAHRALTPDDDIATVLGQSLVRPVRWPATLEALAASGATEGLDTGPGATLANLARFTPTLPFRARRDPSAGTTRSR